MGRHLWMVALLLVATPLSRAQEEIAHHDEDRPRPAFDSSTPLNRQIDSALNRAVRYLLNHQQEDGGWGASTEEHRIGATALVAMALLNAGQSHQSPAIVEATRFLKSSRPESTYSVALRAAFYSLLPEPLRKTELPADFRWLTKAMIATGDSRGLYGYHDTSRRADLSNSQYGTLGVWYAALAGLEVPTPYWRAVERGWLDRQSADGGWGYSGGGESYGSMTAAGAATLYITNDYLHASKERDLKRKIDADSPINRAIRWLGHHYAVDHNPGRDRGLGDDDMFFGRIGRDDGGWYVHYMLFGYERVGEASGLTYFGKTRWFERGAKYLIRTQEYDGSWIGRGGPNCDTAWSVLFLSRGRAPVAMQKLQFDGRWNNRSRDAAHAVRWLSRQSERHHNWQIVNADATLAEMRESPLLYVASDEAINLRDDQKRKLWGFIEQGGLLLAADDGDSRALTQSIEALAKEWFPNYQFRELPPEHLLFRQNFAVKDWNHPVRALSNGVRELIVLLPEGDMSWRWQAGPGTKNPLKAPAFSLMANLSLYATESANARFKGDDWWIEPSRDVSPKATFQLARLKYDGNWDPEPAGWKRLANVLLNIEAIGFSVQVTSIDKLDSRIGLAHLAVTDSLELNPAELALLRRYLNAGGVLLIDAAGGSTEAAVAVETLVARISEQPTGKPLPPGHAIYRADPAAEEIRRVRYRRFGMDRLPGQPIPRLHGIEMNGKLAIVYSTEDLSAGLVGYARDGITGYTPESATQLVRNIILWRMHSTP